MAMHAIVSVLFPTRPNHVGIELIEVGIEPHFEHEEHTRMHFAAANLWVCAYSICLTTGSHMSDKQSK